MSIVDRQRRKIRKCAAEIFQNVNKSNADFVPNTTYGYYWDSN